MTQGIRLGLCVWEEQKHPLLIPTLNAQRGISLDIARIHRLARVRTRHFLACRLQDG